MTSREALQELMLKYNIPHHILEPLRLLDKRDTPMKPKMSSGEVKYYCSVCDSTLDIPLLREVNFCPKCGKRIMWSESI